MKGVTGQDLEMESLKEKKVSWNPTLEEVFVFKDVLVVDAEEAVEVDTTLGDSNNSRGTGVLSLELLCSSLKFLG